MLSICLRLKTYFLAVVILFILAATTAAAADFHADLRYHDDCVLCQLAQLSLIEPPVSIDVAPLLVALVEISLLTVVCFLTPTISPHLVRGPPCKPLSTV